MNHEWLREQDQKEATRACSREWIDEPGSISGEAAIEKKRSFLEIQSGMILIKKGSDLSGADAVGGHTRSHPEHDG